MIPVVSSFNHPTASVTNRNNRNHVSLSPIKASQSILNSTTTTTTVDRSPQEIRRSTVITNINQPQKQQKQSNYLVLKPKHYVVKQPSSSSSSSTTTKSKQQHQSEQRQPKKLTPKEEEFKWLNWVYNQWKDVEPGTKFLEENVIKNMIVSVPFWARRKDVQSAKRSEELLERLIQETLIDNPHMMTSTSATNSTPTSIIIIVTIGISFQQCHGRIRKDRKSRRRTKDLTTDGIFTKQ